MSVYTSVNIYLYEYIYIGLWWRHWEKSTNSYVNQIWKFEEGRTVAAEKQNAKHRGRKMVCEAVWHSVWLEPRCQQRNQSWGRQGQIRLVQAAKGLQVTPSSWISSYSHWSPFLKRKACANWFFCCCCYCFLRKLSEQGGLTRRWSILRLVKVYSGKL